LAVKDPLFQDRDDRLPWEDYVKDADQLIAHESGKEEQIRTEHLTIVKKVSTWLNVPKPETEK
jgi:hypothetical protein